MLIISRKLEESIIIGENIKVTIKMIERNRVRLSFEAPDEVLIYRKEIYDRMHPELPIKEEDEAIIEEDELPRW